MHRLLRLLTLWLVALALPIQGATAATVMALPMSPTLQAAMADMPSGAMPCPHHHALGHAADKAGGCGTCCGPTACQPSALAVALVAEVWAPAVRAASAIVAPQFLTGGPDRPPHPVLA